jgi:hypothetical protein
MYTNFCPYLRLLPLKKHVEIFVLKTVSNYTIKLTRKPRHFYQIQLIFKQKQSDRIGGFGSDRLVQKLDRIGPLLKKLDRDRIGRLLKRLDRIWIGSVAFWKDGIELGSETDPIQLCQPLSEYWHDSWLTTRCNFEVLVVKLKQPLFSNFNSKKCKN